MVKESNIQHELDTYNAVLGDDGELGCTLLIEISDEAERAILLHRWRDLPGHIFMAFTDGTREAARFDEEQMSDEKLSSVQFLKFNVGHRTPSGLMADLLELKADMAFSQVTRAALAVDLGLTHDRLKASIRSPFNQDESLLSVVSQMDGPVHPRVHAPIFSPPWTSRPSYCFGPSLVCFEPARSMF